MIERSLQSIENVAINPSGLADDLELGLFPELPGDVADQARKTANTIS